MERDVIEGRDVWLRDPYEPSVGWVDELVGRTDEMRLITAAWMPRKDRLPLAPLLVGEPGIGKNRIVYELARLTGRPLYILQGHEDVTAEDLACTVRFNDVANSGMEYVVSELGTAMHRGGVCFIDEIGKIRPRALALLCSVLDERRYIDSSLLAHKIGADDGFRFICATNTGDVNLIPEFIRSRLCPVIKVGYPSKKEVNDIINHHYGYDMKNHEKLLDGFWLLWKEYAKKEKVKEFASPRDAIHIFGLATSLADFDRVEGRDRLAKASDTRPFPLSNEEKALDLTVEQLARAFEELFGPDED